GLWSKIKDVAAAAGKAALGAVNEALGEQ
uniref:Dermaseptin-H2 n=1 Tax=Pithecopus azureus TaxID=2034991 RepID=DRS2_PITAZ|nr:RecName: Full=Dermaseptin-H2; AltName: Full=Dermaseptin-like peptide 2; Short=DMS2 [Pithecopus azureus]